MPRPAVLALGVLAIGATGVDVRLVSRFEPSGPVLPHTTENALLKAGSTLGSVTIPWVFKFIFQLFFTLTLCFSYSYT